LFHWSRKRGGKEGIIREGGGRRKIKRYLAYKMEETFQVHCGNSGFVKWRGGTGK
jgi:hypothetical protein